jgi:hypothetical protein
VAFDPRPGAGVPGPDYGSRVFEDPARGKSSGKTLVRFPGEASLLDERRLTSTGREAIDRVAERFAESRVEPAGRFRSRT